jgi:hypothetical protein
MLVRAGVFYVRISVDKWSMSCPEAMACGAWRETQAAPYWTNKIMFETDMIPPWSSGLPP